MILNIITACKNPINLKKIGQSINIPKELYRWIVVYDSNTSVDDNLLPDNCEFYFHKNLQSLYGNDQRNFGLDLIQDGYIYFIDDNTILHPNFYNSLNQHGVFSDSRKFDFISFIQSDKSGRYRFGGDFVRPGKIHISNFIIHSSILGDVRFKIDLIDASGFFAEDCYRRSKSKLYIREVLSIHNMLRYPI